MNKQKWLVVAVVLALTGSTAAFMNHLQAGRKLGLPGLKMIQSPVYDTNTNVVGNETVDLPLNVLDYQSEPVPVSLAELEWLPSDTTFGRRHYLNTNDFSSMDISVVLMGTDRTSIHKPQVRLEGQGWSIEQSDLVKVPMSRPHPYELPVMRLVSPAKRLRVGNRTVPVRAVFVYWFVSDHRLTAQHSERMWWMAKDLVTTGVLPRWAYVACYTFCEADQVEPAFERMKEFIAASVPDFQLVAGPRSGG